VALCVDAGANVQMAVSVTRPEDAGFSSVELRRVDDLMRAQIDTKVCSGAVTLIARHGRVAQFQAYGLMDLDSKIPMQKDAIFRLMSMTKPVVGVAVMLLVEDGKIRLTDPASRFIPELAGLKVAALNISAITPVPTSGAISAPPATRIVDADRQVTIRDLLTHTSGLMSGGTSSAVPITVAKGESFAQILPRLVKLPLDFQPGTRWAYSPFYGFDALLHIVEIASGMPFDQFAQQRIFGPLGMKDTFFYRSGQNARTVAVYQQTQGELKKAAEQPFLNGVYLSGGAGLASTAPDYFQFASMLLNGGALGGTRILNPRSVALMTSPSIADTLPGRTPGEGFGLSIRVVTDPASRNTYVSKGTFGWSGAYNTHFFVDPEEQLVAIMMMQTAGLENSRAIRNDFETAVMLSLVNVSSPR
jgi:CubicO group peptidase (beta-lactamase class C family)